jgi:hypothetical protein
MDKLFGSKKPIKERLGLLESFRNSGPDSLLFGAQEGFADGLADHAHAVTLMDVGRDPRLR